MQSLETPIKDVLDPFEDDRSDYVEDGDAQLTLDLDGFAGPIDALLKLARDQKVDLSKISILALADQYLEFVTKMRRFQLEIAADYLVMAATMTAKITNSPTMALARNEKYPAHIKMPSKAKTKPLRG